MKNNNHTFTIEWDAQLGQYVATCLDLPMLSGVDRNPATAFHLLLNSIEEEANKPYPDPLYTGYGSDFDW